MWEPKYIIKPRLLRTIREIGETLGTIRATNLPEAGLVKMAAEARALSTYASTSIEGNPLPLTDVKRLLKNSPAQLRDTEREILNYDRALNWVHTEIAAGRFEPTTKTFERIQGIVTDGLMPSRSDIGKLRRKPVVIRDPRTPDGIVFLPPDHTDVRKLCDALFAFVRANLTELDPILVAGLFHREAVIVHPFMDGNGRSTRIMTTAILGLSGLDVFPIFSFEAYYNRNVTRYFQMVGERGDYNEIADGIDHSDWLVYFAEGMLDELKRVQKSLPPRQPRLQAHHRKILDFITEHGSITQRDYGTLTTRSLAARKNDFAHLVEQGMIRPVGSGRSRAYVVSDGS